MSQSNLSQVFIQFQEFLQRRYEGERDWIRYLTRELHQAQEWNSLEIEGWKAEDLEDRDEEWTNGYNLLRDIEKDYEREDELLEERWIANENKKPNMI